MAGIRQIHDRERCTLEQAAQAYEVHGWDLDAARASFLAIHERDDRRQATDALARTLLHDGTLADLVILGQHDDQSTEPEEVLYYVAGFFERIRDTAKFLSFDCGDLNRGLISAAQTVGLSELHALVCATLLLPEDDRVGDFCNRMDEATEQVVLERVRSYIRGNMSSFRVLCS